MRRYRSSRLRDAIDEKRNTFVLSSGAASKELLIVAEERFLSTAVEKTEVDNAVW